MRTVIAALVLLLASSASAQEHVYRIDPAIDLAVLALSAGVGLAWVVGEELAPPACLPSCDPDEVLQIDRFATGLYDPGFETAGDVGVAAVYALALGTVGVDGALGDRSFVSILEDAIVIAEAASLGTALSLVVSSAIRRPRPLVYGDDTPAAQREDGRASFSFFSGHTATTFATAVALFETLRRRHPDSPVPWIALGVGVAAASFVGLSRVASGQHFPTDVLVGAGVGTALGFMLPAIHELPVRPATFGSIGLSVAAAF